MKTFPVSLTGLDQKKTVVIGGGKVAFRKVKALLDAGAVIVLISPAVILELIQLSAENQLTILNRPYQDGDLDGACLVIAATDDPDLNQRIWQEAMRCNCLINVVDDPQHSNFILPAVVRRGDFTLSISTGGASPALARRVREQLEQQFGPEYADFSRLLEELRPQLIATFHTPEAKLAAALVLIDTGIIDILKNNGFEAARLAALERWSALSGLK